MDFKLNEEHLMLTETIRKFMDKECPRELVRDLDKKDEFPEQIFSKLTKLGVTGLTIPTEFGGTGRDIYGAVIVLEEISKRYAALGWVFVMSVFYGGENITKFGTIDQQKAYLPKLAEGNILFSYALTEPNAGSDVAAVQTSANKKGSDYIIHGTKTFITGANHSDYMLTLVRTDKTVSKNKGLSLFIVDSKSEGISIYPIEKLGYKGSSACEVVFEDVIVPETNILGGVEFLNRGWPVLLSTLDVEHIEVAACGLGIAEGAFDDALVYTKQREQFGKTIGKFQAISHMLAEMYTEIEASRLIIQRTSWLIQNNKTCSIESAMAKYYATETAKKVSLQSMQILGGYGYTMEYDIQRYVRDSLVLPIGGGTTQIMKNIIAGRLGL